MSDDRPWIRQNQITNSKKESDKSHESSSSKKQSSTSSSGSVSVKKEPLSPSSSRAGATCEQQ